ncbi:MAG: phenylacetate-CoA oxygenase subunit PaaC [Bacteroidetes bacterium]|nr:phenylacetate-CoA oxygenase subunit PaaC [Bacteroidota bacterium]
MSNKVEALKELLYKMADDQLILGHRNSEWIGIGPIIEEDIAFGSLAQDKTGHAWNLYQLLEKMGEGDPDHMAFSREENAYKCSHLTELPTNGDFAFSLVRHFYFDHAESLRFAALSNCSYPDLSGLARKFYSEIKYHVFHANSWVKNLLNGNEESKAKMITALKETLPYALGIFENGPHEETLISEGLFIGEEALKAQWVEHVSGLLSSYGVELDFNVEPKVGGRNGYHTEHLKPLLDEMTEVVQLEDKNMDW